MSDSDTPKPKNALDDEVFRYARKVAKALAMKHGRSRDMEEYVAEANLAVVASWPRLIALYGTVDLPLVGMVVTRGLTDWDRRQRGRGDNLKPHYTAASIDAIAEAGIQLDLPNEAEMERATLDAMALRQVLSGVNLTDRERTICEWIMAGSTQSAIAHRLHVTPARVNQVLKSIGNTRPQIRELLRAA